MTNLRCLAAAALLLLNTVPLLAQNQAPTATFTWEPSICEELWVTFDALGSYDPEGSLLTYEWNFGDGTPIVTTDGRAISHYYTYGGYQPYYVSMCVYDDLGSVGCFGNDVVPYRLCSDW